MTVFDAEGGSDFCRAREPRSLFLTDEIIFRILNRLSSITPAHQKENKTALEGEKRSNHWLLFSCVLDILTGPYIIHVRSFYLVYLCAIHAESENLNFSEYIEKSVKIELRYISANLE